MLNHVVNHKLVICRSKVKEPTVGDRVRECTRLQCLHASTSTVGARKISTTKPHEHLYLVSRVSEGPDNVTARHVYAPQHII
jgi:hypothetical protein